jgi:nicotinic acid mononucleotide adenylyltransferase
MKLDRFYQSLYDLTGDAEILVEAGWISHKSIDIPEQLANYTTPIHGIEEASGQVAVLFYPGCFAPVHEGHVRAMKTAREAVEATGETVVAAFFSPDHDDYVQRKTNDPRFYAEKRISLLNSETSRESWLRVDPWPAYYAPTDLNFTTLYARLENYLQRWLPNKQIKLYMVFGGDNYLFANTFVKYGYGVCVPREGTVIDMARVLPEARERVLFAGGRGTDHSSTAIRTQYLAEHALEGRDLGGSNYVLRNDLELALEDLNLNLLPEEIAERLQDIMAVAITGLDLNLTVVDVEEQLKTFKPLKDVISLDCFYRSSNNIDITRLFNAADSQGHSDRYVPRPGALNIYDQVRSIPQGNYTLVDDDVATGRTVNYMRTLLESHNINITDVKTLIADKNLDLYDVLDLRDFILGARHGGLTVSGAQNGITRMPYAAPYVNLETRARISPSRLRSLNESIWSLNLELYADTGYRVRDIMGRQNFELFGFDEDTTVEALCEQHVKLFT